MTYLEVHTRGTSAMGVSFRESHAVGGGELRMCENSHHRRRWPPVAATAAPGGGGGG